MKLAAELWDWFKTLAIALIIVLVLHTFVFNLSTVEGHSMEPTLTEKEWLFVNKLVYLTGNPGVGDVVILEEPGLSGDEQKLLVKRVVGVPGDRIEISGNRLYRNGEAVDEPYTDIIIEGMGYGPVIVEEGHYFVLGDNRHQHASKDSRSFGSVSEDFIRGRAEFVLWPYKQVRGL